MGGPLLLRGAYLTHPGTIHDQVVEGVTRPFPARSVMVFAKEPVNAWLSEMPLSEVISMVAVLPSELRVTVVGSVVPLAV
jgi:hypothetical protein